MAYFTGRTKEYNGVTLNIKLEPRDSKRDKLEVSFSLNDSSYENNKILPKGASDLVVAEALTELEYWAETIINENKV